VLGWVAMENETGRRRELSVSKRFPHHGMGGKGMREFGEVPAKKSRPVLLALVT
jgi:hypothetical protein